jgi:hypothetical protein
MQARAVGGDTRRLARLVVSKAERSTELLPSAFPPLLFSVYSQRPSIGPPRFSFVLDEVMLLSPGERP